MKRKHTKVLRGVVKVLAHVGEGKFWGRVAKSALAYLPSERQMRRMLPSARDVQDLLPDAKDVKNLFPSAREVKKMLPSARTLKKLLPDTSGVRKLLPTARGFRRLRGKRILPGFSSGWAARGHVEHALSTQHRVLTGLLHGTKSALIWSGVVLVAGVALSHLIAPPVGGRQRS